jgi:carbon storage regulator
MLVITRHTGERICIGDQIEVTVLKVRGQEVQLGLSAPPGVPIHRLEIYQRILANAQDAASLAPAPKAP